MEGGVLLLRPLVYFYSGVDTLCKITRLQQLLIENPMILINKYPQELK